MKSLIKNNILMARKFNNTMRYINDLLVLNNTNFNDAINDIYPPELQLKKTTENTTAVSYLDIFITIKHRKYSTTLTMLIVSSSTLSTFPIWIRTFHVNQHMGFS